MGGGLEMKCPLAGSSPRGHQQGRRPWDEVLPLGGSVTLGTLERVVLGYLGSTLGSRAEFLAQ